MPESRRLAAIAKVAAASLDDVASQAAKAGAKAAGVVIDDTALFNDKLADWETFYNYHRPHGALGGQTETDRTHTRKIRMSAMVIAPIVVAIVAVLIHFFWIPLDVLWYVALRRFGM